MMRDERGLRFFSLPEGNVWQPRWCPERRGLCTVMAAQMADGTWHYFESFVTETEARRYQETQGVRT